LGTDLFIPLGDGPFIPLGDIPLGDGPFNLGRLDGIEATGLPAAPSSSSGHAFHFQYLDDSYSLVDKVLGPVHNTVNHWEPTRDVLDWKDNRNTLDVTQVKFDYTINDIGQRVSGPESGTHLVGPSFREWIYNSRGELVSESANGHNRGYEYDAIGNRIRSSVGSKNPSLGAVTTYHASPTANNIPGPLGGTALNQYGEVGAPGVAPAPVVHDLDGNMTSGPLPAAPGEASTLKWDAENRLIETQVGSAGPLVRYHYDPFGRRIAKTVGTSTTPELYLYDGWNLVAKYTGDLTTDGATLDTSYTWGLDLSGTLQGAGGVGGLLAIHEKAGNGSSKAGQVIYPAYDGNGNIVRFFNSGGGTVASYAYDGFGNRLNPAASDIDASGYAEEQEFGFSTKFRDVETGLYYYGYRYYDPVTGRWPSRDPIESLREPNLYGFVTNDAITSVDMIGLFELSGGSNCLGYAMTGELDEYRSPGEFEEVEPGVHKIKKREALDDYLERQGWKCSIKEKLAECQCDCKEVKMAVVIYKNSLKENEGKDPYSDVIKIDGANTDLHAIRAVQGCSQNYKEIPSQRKDDKGNMRPARPDEVQDGNINLFKGKKFLCCCKPNK
jgi:RHS repeat-associated protein